MKYVSLTFDDGPSIYTKQILKLLQEYNAKATFFIVGSRVKDDGQLEEIISAGHEIGNHTYTHINCKTTSAKVIRNEIKRTQEAINYRAKLFRPPGGMYDNRCFKELQRQALEMQLWTIDSQDWKGISDLEIYTNVVINIQDKDVVLFHEHADLKIASEPMVKALFAILDFLRVEGYECITASELKQIY